MLETAPTLTEVTSSLGMLSWVKVDAPSVLLNKALDTEPPVTAYQIKWLCGSTLVGSLRRL